jgi:2-haloacid dehalogenase
MIKVLVFDVNETLLDLQSLNSFFEKKFGNANVTKEWFNLFIHNALVSTITSNYHPFGKIGLAALEIVATNHQLTITDSDKAALAQQMQQLPPHPEVKESLQKAKQLGYIVVTLTNSTEEVVTSQLKNAGIFTLFDRVFSADTVKRLKPAPEPYRLVAQELNVEVDELMLVAAHAWDIEGALGVGCKAAFIARPGKVLNPLAPKPDLQSDNLATLVTQLSALSI